MPYTLLTFSAMLGKRRNFADNENFKDARDKQSSQLPYTKSPKEPPKAADREALRFKSLTLGHLRTSE